MNLDHLLYLVNQGPFFAGTAKEDDLDRHAAIWGFHRGVGESDEDLRKRIKVAMIESGYLNENSAIDSPLDNG